jgi:Leucine-rich repeat (LRR) protein
MSSSSNNNAARSSSSNNTYERRLARQRQLELMEAAASGMQTPDTMMELNLSEHEEEITFTSLSAPSTSTGAGGAPTSRSTAANTTTTSVRASALFERDDLYNSGRPAVNLMDHTTGMYTAPPTRKGYVSQFLEGVFRTSGGGRKTSSSSSSGWDHADASSAGDDTNEYSTFKNRKRTNPLVAYGRAVCRTRACKIAILLVCLAMIVVTTILLTRTPDSVKEASAAQYRFETVAEALLGAGAVVAAESAVNRTQTAEYQALRWIAWTDGAKLEADDPMLAQRYALAVLFYSSFERYQQVAGAQHVDEDQLWKTIPNPGWMRRDYWLSDKSHCLWYGIDCSAESKAEDHFQPTGHYEDLGDNHVVGTIPPSLKALSKLDVLDLSLNKLTGTIPTHLGDLTGLSQLVLENNKLEGTIPKSLGNIIDMKYLRLGSNQLKGPLPTEIGRLVNIKHLSAESNALTGQLPDLNYLTRLSNVWLDNNQFSGTLPRSWGTFLDSLKELHLSKNLLTGSVPPELSARKGLKSINLDSNHLNGTLSSDLFQRMSVLETLNLQHNRISGSIPTSFGYLFGLHTLLLNGNRFSGSLPADVLLSGLGGLQIVHLQDNNFTGPLVDFSLFPDLEEFWAFKNHFEGAIPESIGACTSLETLYLEHNGLSGPFPSEIGNLTKLQEVRIFDNALTGSIAKHVCDLKTSGNLVELSIDCAEVSCKDGCCHCKD